MQRPVTRNGQNTFVTVLTTQTSRWRVRRSLPVANQGAPTPPRAVTVKEAKPFDGSVLKVSWTAPASSGAGAVAAYRVFVDGKLKASPAGTSATVKNAGPGKHTIKVAAVNAAGTSAASSDAIKLAALSKPRKVDAKRGKAGAPSTVTLEWKAPADAGGFTLKKYEVAIFKGSRKVDTEKLSAKKRKVVLTLAGGQYTFRVRAKNTDRWGPWRKKTDRCGRAEGATMGRGRSRSLVGDGPGRRRRVIPGRGLHARAGLARCRPCAPVVTRTSSRGSTTTGPTRTGTPRATGTRSAFRTRLRSPASTRPTTSSSGHRSRTSPPPRCTWPALRACRYPRAAVCSSTAPPSPSGRPGRRSRCPWARSAGRGRSGLKGT